MPAATRVGDADIPHCSPMVRAVGSPNVLVNGIPWSRQSDVNVPHLLPGVPCPAHAAPITLGSSSVRINGLGAGRIGDAITGCTFVASGSPNVFAGPGPEGVSFPPLPEVLQWTIFSNVTSEQVEQQIEEITLRIEEFGLPGALVDTLQTALSVVSGIASAAGGAGIGIVKTTDVDMLNPVDTPQSFSFKIEADKALVYTQLAGVPPPGISPLLPTGDFVGLSSKTSLGAWPVVCQAAGPTGISLPKIILLSTLPAIPLEWTVESNTTLAEIESHLDSVEIAYEELNGTGSSIAAIKEVVVTALELAQSLNAVIIRTDDINFDTLSPVPFEIIFQAAGAESYALYSGIPPGVLDLETGELSGEIIAVGAVPFSIIATGTEPMFNSPSTSFPLQAVVVTLPALPE